MMRFARLLVTGCLIAGLAGTAKPARAVKGAGTAPVKAAAFDRSVLPPKAPPFSGKIAQSYKDSVPDWKPALPLAAPEGAPNELLVVLDYVGFGHLGSYGGPVETPNLDALAGIIRAGCIVLPVNNLLTHEEVPISSLRTRVSSSFSMMQSALRR